MIYPSNEINLIPSFKKRLASDRLTRVNLKMEQDVFRRNDTWKGQVGDASSSFPAERKGRVIEEAKNHAGESVNAGNRNALLRESSRHVCSILVDCRSLTPLCLGGLGHAASAHVTQCTHLIRLAAVSRMNREKYRVSPPR